MPWKWRQSARPCRGFLQLELYRPLVAELWLAYHLVGSDLLLRACWCYTHLCHSSRSCRFAAGLQCYSTSLSASHTCWAVWDRTLWRWSNSSSAEVVHQHYPLSRLLYHSGQILSCNRPCWIPFRCKTEHLQMQRYCCRIHTLLKELWVTMG